jgi:hypothetical protein
VVPNLASPFRIRLVGCDVEVAIDLSRVGDDDLAAKLARELEGDPRLADAGRSDDDRNS